MGDLVKVNKKHHDDSIIYKYALVGKYNNYYKAGIQLPGVGINIKGVLMSPVSLSFGSEFSAARSGNMAATTALGVKDAVIGSLPKTISSGIKNSTSATVASSTALEDTVQKYEGPKLPACSVDILVMKEFTPDYKSIIEQSLKLTTPLSVKGMLVTGPYDYRADTSGSDPDSMVGPHNSCNIIVGKHLKITHMLCTDFNWQPSTQVRKDGEPVYIKLSYTFSAGRALAYDEVLKWFRTL